VVKQRLISVLFSLVVVVLPSTGFGWENTLTHPDLTSAALNRVQGLDSFLKEQYGLTQGPKRGLQTEFAVQLGFGPPEVDNDVGPGGPTNDSRFVRSWNLLDDGIFPFAPENARIDFSQRCASGPGFDDCFAALPRTDQNVERLLRAGACAEDNPNVRASHHFHDPVYVHDQPVNVTGSVPTGNRGLDNTSPGILHALLQYGISLFTNYLRGGGDFELFGRSARDRSLNLPAGAVASNAAPLNYFALPDAERYLYRAVTASGKDERENSFALHFLAIGSVLHLLEDMTSVAHVRNDFWVDHVLRSLPGFGPTLETFGSTSGVAFLSALTDAKEDLYTSRPASTLAAYDAKRFPGPYDAALTPLDPTGFDAGDFWSSGDPTKVGLADFVNPNFFSAGTLGQGQGNPSYPSPTLPACDAITTAGTGDTFLASLPLRDPVTGNLRPDQPELLFVSSALVPHLARCNYHAFAPALAVVTRPAEWWTYTVIDESVQRDYVELLFPLAIDYAAKFLQSYFIPRIDVIPTGQNHFELRNLTPYSFQFQAGAVEIAYDDVNGMRQKVAALCGDPTTMVTLQPANQPGSTSALGCTLAPASNPAPASADDFWVVVRGALGQRGQAGAPTDFDGKTKDFVVAFKHLQPTILFDHVTVANTSTNLDIAEQDDIWKVNIDPQHPLQCPPLGLCDPSPTATNLTNPIRLALGRPEVDFAIPKAEPNGRRLAIRSDRDQVSGSSNYYVEIASPLDLFLFDPTLAPTDPNVLQNVSVGHSADGVLRHFFFPRWSTDGSAIFYFEALANNFFAPSADRFNVALGTTDPFSPASANAVTSDPNVSVDSLPLGTLRSVCQGIDAPIAARSPAATPLAVSALCWQEQVVRAPAVVLNQWEFVAGSQVRRLRLMNLFPSTMAPGSLDGSFTDRIDIGSLQVINCASGTGPASCGNLGAEPNGEDFAEEVGPAWSLDGQHLAFLRLQTRDQFTYELYVADMQTRTVRLVVPRSFGKMFDVDWSPDGKWLVLLADDGTGLDIYIVSAQGNGFQTPLRMTRGAVPADAVTWYSPLALPNQ
jgi:hypothetical protein